MNKKMYKFLALLLVLMTMGFNLLAQSEHRVAGKMYIDSLGFVYVSVGDTLNLNDTITTVRDLTLEKRGTLSFAPNSDWKSDNRSFVDGYVRSHKGDAFVFPVGQGTYRPARISAADDIEYTDAAYYGASLTAFPVSVREDSLLKVSNEVWIIQGKTPATISLSWTTDISAFVGAEKLCVAGWDTTAKKWMRIESEIDVMSPIFKITSNLKVSGSISTADPIECNAKLPLFVNFIHF